MPTPATPQILRQHAAAFAVSFVSLTALLLANFAFKRLPDLTAREDAVGRMVELLLLAVPFTAALTIPMAVFVAVLWVFTRLGAKGVLATAGREPHGVRRLVGPTLGSATVVAAARTPGLEPSHVPPRTKSRSRKNTLSQPPALSSRWPAWR